MAVPKARTSKRKRNMRRSHDALKMPGLSQCPNCEAWKSPHHVCKTCGFFKGQAVVNIENY